MYRMRICLSRHIVVSALACISDIPGQENRPAIQTARRFPYGLGDRVPIEESQKIVGLLLKAKDVHTSCGINLWLEFGGLSPSACLSTHYSSELSLVAVTLQSTALASRNLRQCPETLPIPLRLSITQMRISYCVHPLFDIPQPAKENGDQESGMSMVSPSFP
jgi:hypothetical protein